MAKKNPDKKTPKKPETPAKPKPPAGNYPTAGSYFRRKEDARKNLDKVFDYQSSTRKKYGFGK